MKTTSLGLGNVVLPETEVLHSSVVGIKSFGRICDLIAVWSMKHHQLPLHQIGDLRVLVQSLFEFCSPKEKPELGEIEFAIEKELLWVSIRYPNQKFLSEPAEFEKLLSQFWVNSDDALTLKKILNPVDRVEVRLHQQLNLIEWRICRQLTPQEMSMDEVAFAVLIDDRDTLVSEHENYTELGDLPFQQLLDEIYQSKAEKTGSGEFFQNGESLQEEDEMVRVRAEREQQEIDTLVRASIEEKKQEKLIVKASGAVKAEGEEQIIKGPHPNPVSKERVTTFPFSKSDIEEAENLTEDYLSSLTEQFNLEQNELKEAMKNAIRQCKKKELLAERQVLFLENKLKKIEVLLKQKEKVIIKTQKEIKILNEKLAQMASAPKEDHSRVFKEKAMQMYALLKQAKEEHAALEKKYLELKGKEKTDTQKEAAFGKANEASMSNQQIDELCKKLDRTNRALEAEKAKVKTLSERVMVAEKEAQSAGPMVDDLERKVENSLKLAQQHKKETETMKQKLVQAEGEKNKIKNELTKAQAQIQTLMKRQAA